MKLKWELGTFYWFAFIVMMLASITHQEYFWEGFMPQGLFFTCMAYTVSGVLDGIIGIAIYDIYRSVQRQTHWARYIKPGFVLLILVLLSVNNNIAYALHFQNKAWLSGTESMWDSPFFPYIAGCWPIFALIFAVLSPHKEKEEAPSKSVEEQLQEIENEKRLNVAKAGLARQKAENKSKGIAGFIEGIRKELGRDEQEPKAAKEPKAKKPAPASIATPAPAPAPSPLPLSLPQPVQEPREIAMEQQLLPIETVKVEGYNPRTKEIIYQGRTYWTRKYASEQWSIALGTLSRIEEKLRGAVILYVDNNTTNPAHFFAADSLALVQRAIKAGNGTPTITLLPGRVQEQPTWQTNEPVDEVETEPQELQAQ